MRKNSLQIPLNTASALLCITALGAFLVGGLCGCQSSSSKAGPPKAYATTTVASAPKPSEAASNAQPATATPLIYSGPPLQVAAPPDATDEAPPDPLPVGTRAWDFHTRTLDGQKLTLSSLRGHVTVLDFWATWCGPCVMEIPHLEGVYKQYQGKGVRMVGMSLDTDTASQVPKFVRTAHVTYTVAVDPKRNILAQDHYNAGLLPSLYIIDKKGVVRWCAAGYHDGMMDDVKSELNQLLSEKA